MPSFHPMPNIEIQRIKVNTGVPDEDGALVFADGYLVAVLVQLSAVHHHLEGQWFIELATGLTHSPPGAKFADLEGASDWVAAHVRQRRSAES